MHLTNWSTSPSIPRVSDILQRNRLEGQQEDLEPLLTQTLLRAMDDINCVAIFSDADYAAVFGPLFYSSLRDIPSFLVLVEEGEDLLSPNYKTLKLMEAIRRSGCHVNIIFLSNAEQVGRFLRFGDR